MSDEFEELISESLFSIPSTGDSLLMFPVNIYINELITIPIDRQCMICITTLHSHSDLFFIHVFLNLQHTIRYLEGSPNLSIYELDLSLLNYPDKYDAYYMLDIDKIIKVKTSRIKINRWLYNRYYTKKYYKSLSFLTELNIINEDAIMYIITYLV